MGRHLAQNLLVMIHTLGPNSKYLALQVLAFKTTAIWMVTPQMEAMSLPHVSVGPIREFLQTQEKPRAVVSGLDSATGLPSCCVSFERNELEFGLEKGRG